MWTPCILRNRLGNVQSTKALGRKYLYYTLQDIKGKEVPNIKKSYKLELVRGSIYWELCARHCAKEHYLVDKASILAISLIDKVTKAWSCLSKVT